MLLVEVMFNRSVNHYAPLSFENVFKSLLYEALLNSILFGVLYLFEFLLILLKIKNVYRQLILSQLSRKSRITRESHAGGYSQSERNLIVSFTLKAFERTELYMDGSILVISGFSTEQQERRG